LETEKIDKIRESMENLSQNADILASNADGFPAIIQNTLRLKACIRMMEMALGQVTLTSAVLEPVPGGVNSSGPS
jgi:hypothetical protein